MFKPSEKVVGPIDRIIRVALGLMIVVFSYVLDEGNMMFALSHMTAILIWLTALYAWDPVYAAVYALKRRVEYGRIINGRFK